DLPAIANGGRFDAFIGRVDASGQLDPAFGDKGVVALGGSGDDKAHRVLEYAPGAYVVAVQAESDTPPFGPNDGSTDGKDVHLLFLDEAGRIAHTLRVSTPGLDKVVGLALTPAGQIVVAGVSERGGATADDPEAAQDIFVALIDPPSRR